MEGKRGSECLLKPVSNIDFNPTTERPEFNKLVVRQHIDDAIAEFTK